MFDGHEGFARAFTNYFDYCGKVGFSKNDLAAPLDILCTIKEALYEPVGLWLPEHMRSTDTGIYAHGVKVPDDYNGTVTDDFDLIELPPCKMLVFQGEPYNDEDSSEAIGALWADRS